MERIIFNRMMKYLEKFNIITESQHGFRIGHSTRSAVIEFFQFVQCSLDDGCLVAGLFFDMSRAFDSIAPNFLESKLFNLGFRGVFLKWICSFVSNRKISVKVGHSCSIEHEMDLGVPQGSVLGPLLFILFINDLPKHIKTNKIIMFADDTSFIVTAKSLTELTDQCELLINKFKAWCRANALILNVNKTECIKFELRGSNILTLKNNYDVLVSTHTTKFLGVIVDSNLRWCEHIAYLSKKLSSSYYAISRLKCLLPLNGLLNVYYSLVYSHISYNIEVWGSSIDFNRVFVLQKRILRLIFGLNSQASCRPYFVEHRILTAPCIYIYRCLLYTKDNVTTYVKLSSFHNYCTRNNEVLSVPRHNTSKFETSTLFQCITLFNKLPVSFKSLNRQNFRREVKALMLRKCYYSVGEYLGDAILDV